MIPRSEPLVHAISWQAQLSNSITSVAHLLKITGNNIEEARQRSSSDLDFTVRVPHSFVERIVPGDLSDPLLQQVLPLKVETAQTPGYLTDPLAESSANVQPGIIHKYHGRVLLILTGACAINCRYCFRRHFPYAENQNSTLQWHQALDYIRNDPSITEVIYSGGDPLVNSDKKLSNLTRQIAQIAHVKRLRIHTRLPIVIPERVTDELLDWLSNSRLHLSIVLHTNHANELDTSVAHAIEKLRQSRITLLNQSVLLKGINDTVPALAQLSERLFEMGVLPYYLHLLDKVQGAAHFDISPDTAKTLVGKLTALLPGYLVPKLVFEEPGKASKTLLTPIN